MYVVDIQQAMDLFREADNTPGDGNPYNNAAVSRAVAPNSTAGAEGFGLTALMQRANYQTDANFFPVVSVSTITQSHNQSQIPFSYVASFKQKLISFNFSRLNDGRIGFMSNTQNDKDARVTANQDPAPTGVFSDVKAVAGLQLQGETKDIVVGVNNHLWIFDVTNPAEPKQYPLNPNPGNTPQPPAKSFTQLGVPVEFGSFGKQVEIEGTLVYVMFENGVAVFDISDPGNPYLTTAISNLDGLRRFAVRDGFIFTLGNNGLQVSIGRAVAQVRTYGLDPNARDEICGNPVVINKQTNKMEQPAGVFFQLYGHHPPQQAKVIIRKIVGAGSGSQTETVLREISLDQNDLRIITNPTTGMTIVNGNTSWDGRNANFEPEVIDRNAIYTAEVVIDDDFRARPVEIPFSNLLPEILFQKIFEVRDSAISLETGLTEQAGSFTYLAAGNTVGVEFKINGQPAQLFTSPYPELTGSNQYPVRQIKPNTRAFGSHTDYLVTTTMSRGLYPFTYKATLKASQTEYSEEISGLIRVGEINDEVRKPGSTVVSGVEVNSGSLALSENDISIKGRGLSLELTRSYNSQQADKFGTFGYGWSHSYQISLVHAPGKYILQGGEGSGQEFDEFQAVNGVMKAKAPYLGTLKKNADGSLDYFTKSQTKYHFRQPVENGSPNQYLGNLEYIAEPNGNRITLSYDLFLRLKTVADSSGRSLIFDYEAADNVFTGLQVGDVIQGLQGCPRVSQFRQITRNLEQSVTGKAWRIREVKSSDNTGEVTLSYAYDGKGNLISATRGGTDGLSDPTAAREWKYTYNPTDNGEAKYDHLLKTVKSPNNPDSVTTEYRYFLTNTISPRVKDILMPEGVSNSFIYEGDAVTNEINRVTFTDGRSYQTRYDLTDGRVHTITAPNNAITRLEWTDFGQIKKTTDPQGKVTEIIFDANNNPATQKLTGPDGEKIETVTTFDTKFSKMTSFKDGNGNVTYYEINQTTGNVVTITLPNQRVITFRYETNGDLREVTDQYGTKTVFSGYDPWGNPRIITKSKGEVQLQQINQTFDNRSRQLSKADNLGSNVFYRYDSLDRQIRQRIEDPAQYRETLYTETTYLPEGQPSLIVQGDAADGNGNLTATLSRTENVYDKLQRLRTTTETVRGYDPPFVREFTYDYNSNLRTEQNRRGVTTTKEYNSLNHLTKIVQSNAAESKTVWEAVEIDLVGNPKLVKDLYGNETRYEYDGLQRLKEKRLPGGYTEKLIYDDNNNIVDSFDRNNNQTHYDYDSQNRIEKVTDALGRVTQWTYLDDIHRVRKEHFNGLVELTTLDGLERPVRQELTATGFNYETSYVYEGRNVTITDARQTVTKQKLAGTGEVGETLVENIDSSGNNYKVTTFYNALGGLKQQTDANNRVTTCVYDGFNRKTSLNLNGEFTESWKYDGEGLVSEHTDKRGFVTTVNYDLLGRKRQTMVKERIPVVRDITVEDITYLDTQNKEEIRDARLKKTTLKYDGLRRVTEIENPVLDKKTLVYDGENLTKETDFYNNAEARFTEYKYDRLNRVREIFDRKRGQTVIEYTPNDLEKTVTDRRTNKQKTVFDVFGRTVEVSTNLTLGGAPTAKLVSYTYDGGNNRLSQTDGNNQTTNFDYDKLNRLTTIRHPNNLQTETLTYDPAGNLKTHFDGRGGTTEWLEYNALNQAQQIKDGAGNITKFEFDGGGLMLSKTEPKGFSTGDYRTAYTYNAFGSLTKIIDAETKLWQFEYDETQNLRFVRDALVGSRPNRVTEYQYDDLNRLRETIQPAPEATETPRRTKYEYDKNSNVVKITDPKNQVTTLNYDALDRLETAGYKDNQNVERLSHEFKYDAEDNLWQVRENRNGQARSYSRQYDARNRVTRMVDAFNKAVDFEYDNANNLKKLTAGNRITDYSYDAKNQLDLVKQNNLTIADYDWYDDGLLRKVTYQNNITRNYVYDSADRVSTITNNFGNNQSESFDYGYDANSNRESETRKENGITKRSVSYVYDKLDRLTDANYTWNQQLTPPPIGQQAQYVENSELNHYGYDAVGNRINETKINRATTYTLVNNNGTVTQSSQSSESSQIITAAYDDLNQLKQLNEQSGISRFEYDDNGNLTQISKNGSINKYEYDVRNQLTKAKDGFNNELASFDYDFERKRIAKSSVGVATNYVYAGSQVVNEYQGTNLTANYTIGGGEIVKSEFSNGENNFHFTDALGSVTALTNNQGSLTSRNEYNAFGEVSTIGNSSNSIGYTGQRLDNETGLMALGNGERYYSPTYAQFIQQDSVAGDSMMPQSLNRFSYAYNNPFKYTDLTGNAPNYVEADRWYINRERQQMAEWFAKQREEAGFWGKLKITIMETGYGAMRGFTEGTKEVAFTVGDVVTEQVYEAAGIPPEGRVYSSQLFEAEQQDIQSGSSPVWARAKTVGKVVTAPLMIPYQAFYENPRALESGEISLSEYNMRQGGLLFDTAMLYLGARAVRGAGSPKTFQESWQNLKSATGEIRTSASKALSSIKETAGKIIDKFDNRFGKRDSFFTVQNDADFARLINGGEPWPTSLHKANLGEGFYSWASREDAIAYLNKKLDFMIDSGDYKKLTRAAEENLSVREFTISQRKLNTFKKLDMSKWEDEAVNLWTDEFSQYGKYNPHGFEYVIRKTNVEVPRGTNNFASEHYFSKSVFKHFRAEELKYSNPSFQNSNSKLLLLGILVQREKNDR